MKGWVGLTCRESDVLAITIAASAVSVCGLPSLLLTLLRLWGRMVLHTPS